MKRTLFTLLLAISANAYSFGKPYYKFMAEDEYCYHIGRASYAAANLSNGINKQEQFKAETTIKSFMRHYTSKWLIEGFTSESMDELNKAMNQSVALNIKSAKMYWDRQSYPEVYESMNRLEETAVKICKKRVAEFRQK